MDHELFTYKEADLLGNGGFGEVYKGKYKKTGEAVAIKVIKNFESDPFNKRELDNLKNLSGENIIQLMDSTIIDNTAYLVMELCDGDVSKMGGKLTDLEINDFITQTANGLKIIHDKQIIHRDIKPQNILYKRKGNKMIYKLSDFGLSKFISRTQKMTYCGTRSFMAPEIKSSANANKSADIWSLGKTFCYMISGNFNKLESEHITNGYFKDLISKMLKLNNCERITVGQLTNRSVRYVCGKCGKQL